MDYKSVEGSYGACKNDAGGASRPTDPGSQRNNAHTDQQDATMVSQHVTLGKYTPGEVNMEAAITPDDVTRAGGFGARDDISSFLPVASDLTDFESTIRDAKDYEESQGEVRRPGLGWTDSMEKK